MPFMSNTIAVSTTKSTKRNRTYEAPNRNPVLVALAESRSGSKRVPLTGADISARVGYDVESPYLCLLANQGFIVRKGVRHEGNPGRPPVLWTVTDKGAKRAQRAVR
jgi:hypothetical protein